MKSNALLTSTFRLTMKYFKYYCAKDNDQMLKDFAVLLASVIVPQVSR